MSLVWGGYVAVGSWLLRLKAPVDAKEALHWTTTAVFATSLLMRALKLTALVFLGLLIILAGLGIFVYQSGDDIDKASIGTKIRLQGHRFRLCDRFCINNWLISYHGEGPGMQVMIELATFGLNHPDAFLEILRNLPPESKEETIRRVSFAVTDGAREQAFRSAFGFEVTQLAQHLDR